MKRTRIILFGLLVFCISAMSTFAQESKIVRTAMSQAEIDRIVRTFTANEAEFRSALTEYVSITRRF
jgi:hypothetical protein